MGILDDIRQYWNGGTSSEASAEVNTSGTFAEDILNRNLAAANRYQKALAAVNNIIDKSTSTWNPLTRFTENELARPIIQARDEWASYWTKGVNSGNTQLMEAAADAMENLAGYARPRLLDANGEPKPASELLSKVAEQNAPDLPGVFDAIKWVVVLGILGVGGYYIFRAYRAVKK